MNVESSYNVVPIVVEAVSPNDNQTIKVDGGMWICMG